jgi:uncharacterized coiled-coil DUF342 family protein
MAAAGISTDALSELEDKIRRAAEVVAQLRKERDAAISGSRDAESLRKRVSDLSDEVETLRTEREMVRQRVGKLLEQIDALNAD